MFTRFLRGLYNEYHSSSLIPFVDLHGSRFLLVGREYRKNEKGVMITFIGGKRKMFELDPRSTALREFREEVGKSVTKEILLILRQRIFSRCCTQYVMKGTGHVYNFVRLEASDELLFHLPLCYRSGDSEMISIHWIRQQDLWNLETNRLEEKKLFDDIRTNSWFWKTNAPTENSNESALKNTRSTKLSYIIRRLLTRSTRGDPRNRLCDGFRSI
eukprot:TRINITY_DN15904_c0_g1_i1.p1 TRINITY_DN15904_c0_g1~~TRINITY_DN15904_c0_g1_i1.p1  ORF type:complete len:215 (+),score=34.75 TRINITY_DN15904_c0_g1_i1:39-683(+)